MAEEEDKFYEITFPDGSVTKSSRDFTGKASCVYANKDTYSGDFVNGVRNGKGKYVYANTHIELEEGSTESKIDIYEGDFVQNVKHGIGKMIYNRKGEYFGILLLNRPFREWKETWRRSVYLSEQRRIFRLVQIR
jgi:outer membrane lipoprotein-sorting protein